MIFPFYLLLSKRRANLDFIGEVLVAFGLSSAAAALNFDSMPALRIMFLLVAVFATLLFPALWYMYRF